MEGTASLKGRHALVTGGGSGIGAAITRALLAEGADVSILGRRLEVVERLAAEEPARIHAISADIVDPSQVAAAMESARCRFGPVTVLVNNAGQAISAPLLKTDLTLWSRMIEVNLTGTFLCTQAALPDMLGIGWGRIVNVASTAGLIGYSYVSAYCAAKHGVVGLTRSLALEVARKGITVNAVCPGYTETDILRESVANVVAKTGRSPEEARAEFAAGNPQGRIVLPEEVADTVRWLCRPAAASIHGQAIAVCGGEVMS